MDKLGHLAKAMQKNLSDLVGKTMLRPSLSHFLAKEIAAPSSDGVYNIYHFPMPFNTHFVRCQQFKFGCHTEIHENMLLQNI